jgi:hypothetical protein
VVGRRWCDRIGFLITFSPWSESKLGAYDRALDGSDLEARRRVAGSLRGLKRALTETDPSGGLLKRYWSERYTDYVLVYAR